MVPSIITIGQYRQYHYHHHHHHHHHHQTPNISLQRDTVAGLWLWLGALSTGEASGLIQKDKDAFLPKEGSFGWWMLMVIWIVYCSQTSGRCDSPVESHHADCDFTSLCSTTIQHSHPLSMSRPLPGGCCSFCCCCCNGATAFLFFCTSLQARLKVSC